MSPTATGSIKERIFTLDVIRGFALLGILCVNIFAFAVNGIHMEYVPLIEHKSGYNYAAVLFYSIVCEGKMRGLFTLLFGAGIILATREKEKNGLPVADHYYRRMLWLLAFGLIDSYLLLWRGDVLYEYALIGMLVFAFRNLRARYLIILGLIALCIFTWNQGRRFHLYQNTYFKVKETEILLKHGKTLNEDQKATRELWSELTAKFPPWKGQNLASIKEDLKVIELGFRSSYPDMFRFFKEDIAASQSSEFYRTFWESLGTILLGMGLFKTGFLSGNYRRRTYLIIALIGIGWGYYLGWYLSEIKAYTLQDYMRLYETRAYSTLYPIQVARVVTLMGYASLLVLFCKLHILMWLKKSIAAAGKMALSNYIMQTLLCSILFYGIGFGLFGKLELYQLYPVVTAIFALQVCYSAVWLNYFEMGPLEWIWRSLIYKKFLPNRITNTQIQSGL